MWPFPARRHKELQGLKARGWTRVGNWRLFYANFKVSLRRLERQQSRGVVSRLYAAEGGGRAQKVFAVLQIEWNGPYTLLYLLFKYALAG